ncbi:hypothetical protein OC842_003095 [Tilletia horrida]|uniref:Major facilitator superfamily (MFS) profile domain-containing protein n=1 Tax=Tilletia horrida TaxID=155126 RepID=A0AAN6JRK0_9BASI|nr:hypothetical protein OC842_003095 [Tilletia horrida]
MSYTPPTPSQEKKVDLFNAPDNMSTSSAAAAAADDDKAPATHTAEGLAPTLPKGQTRGRIFSWMLAYSMFVAGMSAASFGYENAIISPLVALPEFVDKYQGYDEAQGGLVFSTRNQNLLFSLPLVGTIFGAMLATPLQNLIGRKWALMACYAFSLPAVFLELFAPNLGAFIGGRLWNGLAYGAALAIGPLMLADLVPVHLRGFSVTSANFLTILSSLIATITVYGTNKIQGANSYRIPLAIQCAIPVLLLLTTVWIPESPVYLINKGRIEDARKVLRRIRGFSDQEVDEELWLIKKTEDERREVSANVRFTEIFSKDQRRRTLFIGSLFSLNQISGIILSTTYATVFLTQLKVAAPFTLTVIAAATQLIGTLTAPLAVEYFGRRTLAMWGMSALVVIDFIAGGLAFSSGASNAKAIAALSFIFNWVWTSSFYALSLLLPSEAPTPRLRNPTMSYAIAWGQTTAVITTFAVPRLTNADSANLGAKTYLVFGGLTIFTLVWSFFELPETKNRTSAEIDELYESGIPKRHWATHVCQTSIKAHTRVEEEHEKNLSTHPVHA